MSQDIFKFPILGERQLKEKQSVSDHKIIRCIASLKAFFLFIFFVMPSKKVFYWWFSRYVIAAAAGGR